MEIKNITNRQKSEIPTNLLTNEGSEIVDEVVYIPGERQTKFHPETIANVLSLNEMNKKYKVTFDSGDENDFKAHIGDNIVKFPAIDGGLYLSNPDNIFRKVAEENKMNTIELLNNLQTVE